MDHKQDQRYGCEWSKIDQQINRTWFGTELLLGNPVFSVARSLAVFVRIMVDLFHALHLCDKAKVAIK